MSQSILDYCRHADRILRRKTCTENRNATSRHYVQVGSITAAHFRGQAVSHDKRLDGMVTVGLGLGEVARCPSTFEQDIKIAAINSPVSLKTPGDCGGSSRELDF